MGSSPDPTDVLQPEKVAALAPDLILGINSYMTAEDYAKLSAIAPTVAQTDAFADGGTPWDQQTRSSHRARAVPRVLTGSERI